MIKLGYHQGDSARRAVSSLEDKRAGRQGQINDRANDQANGQRTAILDKRGYDSINNSLLLCTYVGADF